MNPNRYAVSGPEFIATSRDRLIGLRFLEEKLSVVEGYGFRDPWRHLAGFAGEPEHAYWLAGVHTIVRDDALWPLTRHTELGPLPRVLLVHRSRVVSDVEALRFFREGTADPRRGVLLATGKSLEGPFDCPQSQATLTVEREERLVIDYQACAAGYLVIHDSFFPGWRASVNGNDAEVHRASYLFRAVEVPEGKGRVELVYAPNSFRFGAALSLISLLALVLALRTGRPSRTAASPRATR